MSAIEAYTGQHPDHGLIIVAYQAKAHITASSTSMAIRLLTSSLGANKWV
jgi:hypothetical protein